MFNFRSVSMEDKDKEKYGTQTQSGNLTEKLMKQSGGEVTMAARPLVRGAGRLTNGHTNGHTRENWKQDFW